jgi:DNA-binding transcriptional ArsR family regulator
MRSDVHIITDPKVAKLFADETRRRILKVLSHHELSATDLAKRLEKNHSSIVHHLNMLLEAGLIEITRSEQVRNMIQPYYRSISQEFHVSYRINEVLEEDPDYSAWTEGYLQRLLLGLEQYNIDLPEDERDKVKELLRQCHLYLKRAYEERLIKWTENRDVGRYPSRVIARIMSDVQLSASEEYWEILRELREILNKYSGAPWDVE